MNTLVRASVLALLTALFAGCTGRSETRNSDRQNRLLPPGDPDEPEEENDLQQRLRWRKLRLVGTEDGVYDPQALLRALAQKKKLSAQPAMFSAALAPVGAAPIAPAAWSEIGPSNIAGRVTAIVIDP